MKQITERLERDMRWRLSPAGKRYRPSRPEMEQWGAISLPWTATVLGGCATQALCLGAGISAFDANLFPLGMLSLAMMFAALPLAFFAKASLQTRRDLACYSKLLRRNERFALVEYSRLLKRQIDAARHDPSLGTASDLRQLQEQQARIDELLREGQSRREQATSSSLAAESQFAASVVEAYTAGRTDIESLDARLPEELRARLDELDAAAPGIDSGRSVQSNN